MQIFQRKNGDQVSYKTWGSPADPGVILMHGFPGSHVQAKFLEPLCSEKKLFLAAFDRPGYGLTTDRRQNLEEIAHLTVELADHLGMQRFYLIGVSGGAPSAFSVSYLYPERVLKMGIVCGLAPFAKDFKQHFPGYQCRALAATRWVPRAGLASLFEYSFLRKDPAVGLKNFARFLHASDRDVLLNPNLRQGLIESMMWARQQGARGMVNDVKNFSTDWRGSQRLKVSTYIWHGGQDLLLPLKMAERWQALEPEIRLRIFPEEGHYSLPLHRGQDILDDILNT